MQCRSKHLNVNCPLAMRVPLESGCNRCSGRCGEVPRLLNIPDKWSGPHNITIYTACGNQCRLNARSEPPGGGPLRRTHDANGVRAPLPWLLEQRLSGSQRPPIEGVRAHLFAAARSTGASTNLRMVHAAACVHLFGHCKNFAGRYKLHALDTDTSCCKL